MGKFQFSPLHEGRHCRHYGNFNTDCISILAPTRGATLIYHVFGVKMLFQFSPLHEGRHTYNHLDLLLRHISILAPTRGATVVSPLGWLCMIFQFSPLHEGRHHRRTCQGKMLISILAPTRGATAKTNKNPSISAALFNNLTNYKHLFSLCTKTFSFFIHY